MVILCGVDDSAPAREAARAAAALARRGESELELVYVQEAVLLNAGGPDAVAAPMASHELMAADRRRVLAQLEPLRAELEREFGIRVGLRVVSGLVERELLHCAEEQGATLIVVGAVGRRRGSAWRLGSVADRLSQSAPLPVLVVREAQGFVRWTSGERSLRIVVALAAAPSSVRAAELAAELARLGPCEVIELHVYDRRSEARRLGVEHVPEQEARAVIEDTLARELPERVGTTELERARFGALPARFVALPSDGHVAAIVTELAERERADLIVVGARGRGAIERRFLGSVSYGVVGLSGTSVLVARGTPRAADALAEHGARGPRVPVPVRRALVATDLSETGNRALDLALGLLPAGGQLTLLHVLPTPLSARAPLVPIALQATLEERRMGHALAEAELRKLLPRESAIEIAVDVVESEDPVLAILQAAERHGVDLVLLGRHGHGPLAAALMGSVARAVALRCPRPVVLVPEEASAR